MGADLQKKEVFQSFSIHSLNRFISLWAFASDLERQTQTDDSLRLPCPILCQFRNRAAAGA